MEVEEDQPNTSPSKNSTRKVMSKHSTVRNDNNSGDGASYQYQAASENLHLQKKKFKKMKKGLSKTNHSQSQSKPSTAATSVKLLKKATEDLVPKATIRDMCEIIAGDFYDTAWEICSTRFYFEKASETIVSDLRDTWLSIIEMQWLDSDPDLSEQVCIPDQIDVPPLPPKFDNWSHGALEILPSRQRESVMDPFLREPQPWFLEMFSGRNDDLLKRAPAYSPESWNDLDEDEEDGEDDEEEGEDEDKNYYSLFSAAKLKLKSHNNIDPSLPLNRPNSPVSSSEYSVGNRQPIKEATWSTTTTAGGSFAEEELDFDISAPGESRTLLESPLSAASMYSATRKSDNSEPPPPETPTPSLELLFPSRLSRVPEIKASSEMEYRMGGTGGIPELGRSSQMIAFKLPGQSSSDAMKFSKDFRRIKAKEAATSGSAVNILAQAPEKKAINELSNTETKLALKYERRSLKSNPEMMTNRVLKSKESSIQRSLITATTVSSRQNLLEVDGKTKKDEFKKDHKHKGVRVRVDNA
ncbi:hypothetical protein Ocin01_00054 [Orchesella cincta]|uniref:Uncharacterized protein n=1 Tax=Orchesella cincta TaxID=48709 RepID=A0A1D2NNZ0_ORCCI|nr:hypothetical protein Ocin01_00054 [Orchesella cincta]